MMLSGVWTLPLLWKSIKCSWSECLLLSLGRWRSSSVQGGGTDTQVEEQPEARTESGSLWSVFCLPAAHFLSVHHGVAGIRYDTWPPCGHRGSHLLRLLCFVSGHILHLKTSVLSIKQGIQCLCGACISSSLSYYWNSSINDVQQSVFNIFRLQFV